MIKLMCLLISGIILSFMFAVAQPEIETVRERFTMLALFFVGLASLKYIYGGG